MGDQAQASGLRGAPDQRPGHLYSVEKVPFFFLFAFLTF